MIDVRVAQHHASMARGSKGNSNSRDGVLAGGPGTNAFQQQPSWLIRADTGAGGGRVAPRKWIRMTGGCWRAQRAKL